MKLPNVVNVVKSTTIASVITVFAGISATSHATDESFESTIQLIESIAVTEVANLRFPEQERGDGNVTVTPNSSDAAQFNATGEVSRNVTASIVEADILMKTGIGNDTSQQILVNNFAFGGAVAPDGSGAFDASGNLNNIRVGATATIEAEDQAGIYSGTATFRLVYT